MEAIILAGGLGTRLRSAVPELPKPMAPINGRPFLEHQIDYWMTQGITRFILSVGYKHETIRTYFGDHFHAAEITYVIEQEPLGTGGGLLVAMQEIQGTEPFLILNGDTFVEVNLAKLRRQHDQKQAEITLVLRQVEHNTRYGSIQMAEDGRIVAFQSEPSDCCTINAGVYLACKSAFDGLGWRVGDKASLEQDVFLAMLQAGKCFYGFVASGAFIDIGIPEDYFRASAVLPA